MREDSLLHWVAIGLWACCAVVMSAVAATGAWAEPLEAGLVVALRLWTLGLSGVLVHQRRRVAERQRAQLRAIERLVAALREP
jgi:hypothetical protein